MEPRDGQDTTGAPRAMQAARVTGGRQDAVLRCRAAAQDMDW